MSESDSAKPTQQSQGSQGAQGARGASSSPKPVDLQALVKTVQFAWFVGHVLALVGSFFYLLFSLRIFKSPSFPKFWYREAYVAIIFTFSIILNQTYRSKPLTVQALLRDDNCHYIFLAFLWLFSRPSFFTLPPFLVFSLFHVLTYLRSYLLPALGHGSSSPLSAQIGHFVTGYNDRFMMLAASIECLQFVRLLFRVFTFRKGTLVQFIIYVGFMKLRYDNSMFTRTIVKQYEVRIDSLLANPAVPPVVRNGWISFKNSLAQVFGGHRAAN
uniref:ARAD1D21450p n=1 Tax=Blastobotrys adeninivorans TaxID=409370 RepID=A0A060TG91_BLAAD